MSGDRAVDLLWMLGAMVLVGSALVARRLTLRQMSRAGLIWIAIFVVVVTLVALWQTTRSPEPESTPSDDLVSLHNEYYRA